MTLNLITFCFSDSDGLVRRSVMYPPHLIGSENETMPSAFIPFCSYQSETLGERIPGSKLLACDSLKPVVLSGRLCYTLKDKFKAETKQGKTNGLLLMVDPGEAGHDQNDDEENTSLKLYIHTLSGFTGYKAGSYAMSALKRMTGTSGFLSLPEAQKRCQVELREDCERSLFVEELEKECGCIPWTIIGNQIGKVTFGFNT